MFVYTILQLIQMLKDKSQSYQMSVDNRLMMFEQCQQLQLEADVLNDKLDDARCWSYN